MALEFTVTDINNITMNSPMLYQTAVDSTPASSTVGGSIATNIGNSVITDADNPFLNFLSENIVSTTTEAINPTVVTAGADNPFLNFLSENIVTTTTEAINPTAVTADVNTVVNTTDDKDPLLSFLSENIDDTTTEAELVELIKNMEKDNMKSTTYWDDFDIEPIKNTFAKPAPVQNELVNLSDYYKNVRTRVQSDAYCQYDDYYGKYDNHYDKDSRSGKYNTQYNTQYNSQYNSKKPTNSAYYDSEPDNTPTADYIEEVQGISDRVDKVHETIKYIERQNDETSNLVFHIKGKVCDLAAASGSVGEILNNILGRMEKIEASQAIIIKMIQEFRPNNS